MFVSNWMISIGNTDVVGIIRKEGAVVDTPPPRIFPLDLQMFT